MRVPQAAATLALVKTPRAVCPAGGSQGEGCVSAPLSCPVGVTSLTSLLPGTPRVPWEVLRVRCDVGISAVL